MNIHRYSSKIADITLAAALLYCAALPLFADEPKRYNIPIDLPLLDYPFNFSGGYSFPSMAQSLSISKDMYQLSHYALQRSVGEWRWWAGNLSIAAFDLLTIGLPLGTAWLHEEWHRAVFSRHNISSHNDVYNIDLFSDLIYVSHVTDADLSRLKKHHPADFVRLSEAGIEAEYELNLALEKDAFFFDTKTWNLPILWFNDVNSITYLFICVTNEANSGTDQSNRSDGADIATRDFTGLDFTAWVYDLYRPDEPYENRGVHPSGVGINRYRKLSDLTREEKDFLELQVALSFLNLLDSNLIGFARFNATNPFTKAPFEWNATVRHHLTSFGFTVDLNLFLRQTPWNILFIAHNYLNDSRYFPGVDLELLRYPVKILNRDFLVSPRTALWLQPKDQRFFTDAASLGGLARLKLEWMLAGALLPYVELEAKSEGWVAGNAYLDPSFSAKVGIAVQAF